MYAFDYKRPATLEEARKALEGVAESKLLAGGMSIVPVMRYRLAQPSALIDLGKIEALTGVSEANDMIRIGAMTTHYAVSRSELVRSKIPALAQLAGGIGDPLVRNRGTIGGSLAHDDPAACYPSSILALGATIHSNRRDIDADNFIIGTFTTALEPSEIIVGITGAGHYAFRCGSIEQALSAKFTPETARAVGIPAAGLNDDIHGSAEYRAHLIPELTARAVEHCLAGTPGAII